MEPEAKRRRVSELGRRTVKNYKRHGKPPYSYVGMIALLIRMAPEHKLSLAGILAAFKDLFPFFQGEYQGWRDSVRHNLSHNDCFYMVPQVINNVVKTKKCDWAVHLNKLPSDALRKQEKSSKDTDYQYQYASSLTEHFGLPQIEYLLPCMKLQPRTLPLNGITPLKASTSQVFKTPQSTRALKKKRSFTIDSLLNSKDLKPVSSTIPTTASDALVSHVPIVTFPPTMFDNQTPENALENLRNLCNANPLSYNTPPSVSGIQYEVSKDALYPPVRSFSDLRASSSTLFGLPSPELKHESHKHHEKFDQDRYSPSQMVTYGYETPRSSTPCLTTHQERHTFTPLDTFNYGSPSNGSSMPSPASYHNRHTSTPLLQTPNSESGSTTPCTFTLPESHSSNIVSYEYGTPRYTTPGTYHSEQNTSFFVMPTADCVMDLSRTPRPASLPVLNEHYRIDPSPVNINDLEESMNSTTWDEPRCRSASTVSSRCSSVDTYLPDHDHGTIFINPVSPLLNNSFHQSAFTPYDSGQIVTEATLQNLRIANDFGLTDILS